MKWLVVLAFSVFLGTVMAFWTVNAKATLPEVGKCAKVTSPETEFEKGLVFKLTGKRLNASGEATFTFVVAKYGSTANQEEAQTLTELVEYAQMNALSLPLAAFQDGRLTVVKCS